MARSAEHLPVALPRPTPPGRARSWTLRVAIVSLLVGGTGCASTTHGSGNSDPVGAGILRVVVTGRAYDLRLWQFRPPPHTARGSQACVNYVGPTQFWIEWSAVDPASPLPRVVVSVSGVDGTPVVLADRGTCDFADGVTFASGPAGTVRTFVGALPAREPPVTHLQVFVNGRRAVVPLAPPCGIVVTGLPPRRGPCVRGPLSFNLRNGYSALLR